MFSIIRKSPASVPERLHENWMLEPSGSEAVKKAMRFWASSFTVKVV